MGARDELAPGNALEFLAGRAEVSERAQARLLGGGVSNTVVLVEDGPRRIVLKQALPRLRVQDEWLADRGRIKREWDALEALAGVLPLGRLPEPLFLDEDRFLYAMRAVPAGSVDWKTRLLAGECDPEAARTAGATLGLIARGTWGRAEFAARFDDRTAFRQLRTDPYYRTVARRHPQLAADVEAWIVESSARRVALVHGDWSPKNLLLGPRGLVCIDFECAHYGDPSYDAGFLLTHLVLKAFHQARLAARYLALARVAFAWTLGLLPPDCLGWYEAASVRHAAFLLLARIDGKSPVEYLRSETARATVRRFALRLIANRSRTLAAVLAEASAALAPDGGSEPTRLP